MDKRSPELGKPDYFETMPNPYGETRLAFEEWFNGLLFQINKPPLGYVDKRKEDGSKFTKPELVEFFRQQLRSDVGYWTSEKTHPRDSNRKIPPTPAQDIKDTLKAATQGMLKK